jgi:hypothetical protein
MKKILETLKSKLCYYLAFIARESEDVKAAARRRTRSYFIKHQNVVWPTGHGTSVFKMDERGLILCTRKRLFENMLKRVK